MTVLAEQHEEHEDKYNKVQSSPFSGRSRDRSLWPGRHAGRRFCCASGQTQAVPPGADRKALAFEETDRLPFGFWRHFPNQDRAPRRLAQLSLEVQRKLDLDFIKFTPYGLYSAVDWGVALDVKGGNVPPVQADYPIKRPEEWRGLAQLRGTEGEYLIALEAQRIALSGMRERIPLVQTVFSPLTTALKLAGPEMLLARFSGPGNQLP